MAFSRILRNIIVALVLVDCISTTAWAQSATSNTNKTSVPVGMIGKVEQILIPGGELEAVPTTDPLAKIVVRVADTFRHGDAYRYNLEFTGYEPGLYDLAKSLKRKNPEETAGNIPSIEIEITSSLPPGQIEPAKPKTPQIREWLKYWTILDLFVVVWIIGLALLWGKAKATGRATVQADTPPPSVAQRLKPLVQAACEGTIEPHKRAELESLLINYWSDRLHLNQEIAPGQILTLLKSNPEAGPLINRLEEWLHMPPGQGRATTDDIAGLLQPYEALTDTQTAANATGKGAQ
jgi:hypothetical protein